MPGCFGHEKQVSSRCSTAPSRSGVNRERFNINRALPKVRQSLRGLRLVAYRWRALRVRVMVGYVLRPSPDNNYFGCDCLVRLRSGGLGRFCAGERRRWPALPVVG
jgi:hypothetical protein